MTHYNEASFNRKAAKYEEKWEDYLNHTHEVILSKIETSPGDSILDASSGTGLLASKIIEKGLPFKKLVLNDPSSEMQNLARERVGNHSAVSFTNYAAENLKFEDKSFDKIICLNAFHFYAEQENVLRQFHKLLKQGGKLYLLDWNKSGFFRPVNLAIKWSTSENINTRSFVEIRKILKNCGFHLSEQIEWYWSYWKFFFIEARK